jgi:mRNA-degrading endonuclease toxin of MazEF toxin-antitoxin module
MWSGPEAAGGVATHPELRRGHVWLVQGAPDRGQRAVLLLSRDREGHVDDPLLAAPVIRGAPAIGRIAVDILAGFDGAVVDVRGLVAIDRSALIQPLMRLAAPRLAEVDMALCDVLGLDAPAWHAADELKSAPEPHVSPADEVAPEPAIPPATNGAAPRPEPLGGVHPSAVDYPAPFVQPTAFDRLGFAPPPPPPVMETSGPAFDDVRDGRNEVTGLDDHPIAQLFGRPRPASHQLAPPPAPLRSAAADIRAADVMPQLLGIVQRRLHRSAPRLEAVLSQAGEEDRTVEWAAAAVRHASVRGVMQSTLDEIAGEIAAVGALEARRPEAR